MHVFSMILKIYAPYNHSLKEKRMVTQSIIKRVRNKFNVSIAEVDAQNLHQTIVLGLACVSGSRTYGENLLNEVLRHIEENTEAEVVDVIREER